MNKTRLLLFALTLVFLASARAEVFSVKYKSSLVRVGTPFVFQAKGVDADPAHWSLQNGIGGAYKLSVTEKENVVTVTLLVTKQFRNREFDGAAAPPMITWKQGDKQVNIGLTVVSAKAKVPRRGKEMKKGTIDGKAVWVIPSYIYSGKWEKGPVFFIPIPDPRK